MTDDGDVYDPTEEFEQLPKEERQAFLDGLDPEERSQVIRDRAEKSAENRDRAPPLLGTGNPIRDRIDDALHRSGWSRQQEADDE